MTNLKRIMIGFVCVCLIFTGCSSLSSAIGTLSISVSDVASVTVTTASGQRFTTQDQEQVRSIVDAVNRLTLDAPGEDINGFRYSLSLDGSDGSSVALIAIVDETTVCFGGASYPVDAKSLIRRIEALECDTLTDEELIRTLFESDYLSELTILDEDGRVSLDKISRLGEDFPVLFELIGRPSAAESLSGYGLELLKESLNSSDINLRERAEKIAQFIKSYYPVLEEKINEILETTGK